MPDQRVGDGVRMRSCQKRRRDKSKNVAFDCRIWAEPFVPFVLGGAKLVHEQVDARARARSRLIPAFCLIAVEEVLGRLIVGPD